MKYGLKECTPEDMEQAQQTALINNTEGLASVTMQSDLETYADILGQYPLLFTYWVREIKFETYTGDYSNVHFRVGNIWYKPTAIIQYGL